MSLPYNANIAVTSVWDFERSAYTLNVDWSALYPTVNADTSFRVRALKNSVVLADTSTVNNYQVLYDIPNDSSVVIELTAFLGWTTTKIYKTSYTTLTGLPGNIVDPVIVQGESELAISWAPVSFATDYRVRLFLDGAQIDEQITNTPAVSFTGLPHSRSFRLETVAYNSLDFGQTVVIDTHTVFLVPPAPYDVRQFEERIIAVILQWNIAFPDIIEEVQIQAWDGTTKFLDDVMTPWQTERLIPCPSTGSSYTFRLRSGNPAGWSEWVSFTGYTEVFPLVDSRVGSLGTSYQEDTLRVDTWSGAEEKEAIKEDSVVITPGFTLNAESSLVSYDKPTATVIRMEDDAAISIGKIQPHVTVGIQKRTLSFEVFPESVGKFKPTASVGIAIKVASKEAQVESVGKFGPTGNIGIVAEEIQTTNYPTDIAPLNVSASLTITQEII